MAVEGGIGRAKANLFIEGGKVLFSKVASGSNAKEAISCSVEFIRCFEKIVEKRMNTKSLPNEEMQSGCYHIFVKWIT